jgi:cytochrome c biogenesis factor
MIDLINLGIGLTALIGGLIMLFVALKRHRRDHRANDPRGVAMLIAGMMVTAFGLFITAFAIAFAFGEPVEAMR